MRAEAEAAVAEARKSHERLREAIDILPQGIVFLDAEGRYILWNKKYSEIYSRSSDVFQPGARLQDTIRIGVERGDYPEAIGREEEWIAERLTRLYQPDGRHEQTLADGRVILIEERLTEDGGIIGLRVDITELKQREASFRLLFDSNPVPMIVCALNDERIVAICPRVTNVLPAGSWVWAVMRAMSAPTPPMSRPCTPAKMSTTGSTL